MADWKFDPKLSFQENLAAKKAAEAKGQTPAATAAPQQATQQFEDDLIPEVLTERSENDVEIDNLIDNLDPIEAYRRWIGKEVAEKEVGQPEVHISCPMPGHRDKNPSAWIHTVKDSKWQTWYCGGCDIGGDIYDLASIKHGLEDYKNDGKTFHELRRAIAEDYGYRFQSIPGGEVIYRDADEDAASGGEDGDDAVQAASEAPVGGDEPAAPSVSEDGPDGAEEERPLAPVVELFDNEKEPEVEYPSIDWRSIVPENTFLHEYMKATSIDDSPEEYHFWNAMSALGNAVGRKVFLDDSPHVYGNLMVCLLGGTGAGKSRSRRWLSDVLNSAVPFNDNGLDTTGCKLARTPASGENLIRQFQHIANDPSLPKGMPEVRTPINGFVTYDEFSSFLSRANRQGSSLKQTIMEISDCPAVVSSESNTNGVLEAVKPFCSIASTTQLRSVRHLMSKNDADSGFLNRWVFVGGPKKKRAAMGGKRFGRAVDLSTAIEELKKVRGWGAMEREVYLNETAYFQVFEPWFYKTVQPLTENDSTGLLGRLELTIKKILLLFSVNERRTEIRPEDVERIKPLLEYLVGCYNILNGEIAIAEDADLYADVQKHLVRIQAKTGNGVSVRDLMTRLGRKYKMADIVKMIENMSKTGLVELEKPTSKVGRPTIRYRWIG